MARDLDYIKQVLQQNSQKNFVDRIINKDKYPTMDLGSGNYATHKMSYSTFNNGAMVYPTIVYDPAQKKLVQLSAQEAPKRAVSSGEYINFDKPEDADWFSKNYKQYWGMK